MKRNDVSPVRYSIGREKAGRRLPLIPAVGLGWKALALAKERPTVEVMPGDEADLRTKAAMNGVIVHVLTGRYNLTDYLVLGAGTDLVGETVLVDSVDADGNPGPDGVPDPIDANGNYFDESTATIIDGSLLSGGFQPCFQDCDDLPNTYQFVPFPIGFPRPIITSQGKNRIAHLAVQSTRSFDRGNPWALIGNAQSAEVDLEIECCMIGTTSPVANATTGLINAVSLWHAGCAAKGNKSRLTVTGSVFQRNFHHGITVSNSGTVGTSSHVHITGSRFTGNADGLAASAGNPGDHNEIDVLSRGNIYEGNSMGMVFTAGETKTSIFGVRRGAHCNRLRLTSIDDAIWANNLPGRLRLFTGGGIVTWGAFRDDSLGGDAHTDNEVSMRLVRTRFFKEGSPSQNRWSTPLGPRRDLTIMGAFSGTPLVDDRRNVETYLIRQAQSSDGLHTFIRDDNDDDPTDGNRVEQVGSDVALEAANPAEFSPPVGGVGP